MADTTPSQPDAGSQRGPGSGGEPAGPVLKGYVGVATATRPYLQADKDAPVEDFVAEADRHPVFELLPLDRLAGDHG